MAEMTIVEQRVTRDGQMNPLDGDAVALRIGVVDDDRLLLAALGELLGDEPGFRFVGSAASTAEGVALVACGDLDVLLVDVRMPAGGGAAVAARARAVSPHTAVIALSASGDEQGRAAMAAAGAVDYLVKDTSVSALFQAIAGAAAAAHAAVSS